MLSIKQRELNLRTHCGYYMGAIDGIEGNGLIDRMYKVENRVTLLEEKER